MSKQFYNASQGTTPRSKCDTRAERECALLFAPSSVAPPTADEALKAVRLMALAKASKGRRLVMLHAVHRLPVDAIAKRLRLTIGEVADALADLEARLSRHERLREWINQLRRNTQEHRVRYPSRKRKKEP